MGNGVFAVCPKVCHGHLLGHTANNSFAVCHPKTHGKYWAHGKAMLFHVLHFGTRQSHTLLCAFYQRLYDVSALPCMTHDKHFAVLFWA